MIAFLTCGPLVILLATWCKLVWTKQRPRPIAFAALVIATANASFAVWNFLYYHFKSSPDLPPWKNPEILNYGLFFLLAPIPMIVGSFAAARGAPKWLTYSIWIASAPLLLIGFFAAVAV